MASRTATALLLAGALGLPSPAAATEVPPAPHLGGTWRFDMRIVSHADIPVLGVAEIRSRTVYLAEVTGPPGAPSVRTRVCRMDAHSTQAIATTQIPQAFVNAIPERTVPVLLVPRDGAWSVHIDMTPHHLGYNPRLSPDGVPRKRSHPAVTDFEGDGLPGGTILLDAPLFGIVQIYVVQHAHTILDGTWTGSDTWTGQATVREFEQRSIGASNRLFATNADVTVDSSQSGFRWTRVPDGTSCAALRSGFQAPGADWN